MMEQPVQKKAPGVDLRADVGLYINTSIIRFFVTAQKLNSPQSRQLSEVVYIGEHAKFKSNRVTREIFIYSH